jgi:predicted thioredoxin/glutaredoxin
MILKLYSRPDCHLCERLLDELRPLLAADARIEVVDISEDPDLMRRYGLRIPILSSGGEEITGYPLNPERIRRYLSTQGR